MSWQQRPGSAAPPEGPQYPPHGQPYDNQQATYPNYQQGAPPQGNPQQQYWQNPQQQQYGQQYNQVYQQDYRNNANQFYQQQPQYNQNYSNQVYANQQGLYQNQQAQKQPEGWEDNWGDWGWDESTKQQQQMSQNIVKNFPANVTAQQPQVVNNANVIEESFGSNDTWNWSMDDRREVNEPAPLAQQEHPRPTENVLVKNDIANPPKKANEPAVLNPTEEVKTLSDRDAVKERLPNLAVGKRFHLDNLTPQWSIESQMSQESSDGPHTQSEGTYRSENQSRNSSKSSPGLNTDNSNFCYSQPSLDEFPASTHSNEWSRRSMDEPTLVDNVRGGSRRESHDEISSSLQEMSITNREVPAPDAKPANLQECFPIRPPSGSPAHFVPQVSTVIPPPPKASGNTASATPPLSQSSSGHLPTPPSSTGTLLPPPSFPTSSSSSTNPFKQSGPFSHKKPSASPSLQSFPTPLSSTNLTSPASVNKISQSRAPVGFGANLETTPDNSERPDQPQLSGFRPMPVTHQVPENMEVAPQNDRNEYMQTAHLSTEDFGENTDFSRVIPPPGLRRMVVGQPESEYEQSSNIGGDEPPPGLARMVPGQQTEADNNYIQPNDNYMDRQIDGQPTESVGSARPYRQADGQTTPDNYSQPPTGRSQERRSIGGMDRMVPGESSNIEFSQYSGSNYGGNDQRVVMGVDHDYPGPDAGPSDIREQNVDGSDYSEQASRNSSRNVIGARDVNDVSQDIPRPVDQQREVIMEGENLQDLSIISSAELTFSREHTLDGADMTATDGGTDRRTDLSDSVEHGATVSRRQSLTRVHTSGEESDRDRAFKASPRRDRDKHKSTRDRDRDRDKDRDRYRDKEGRYSRGDRKYRDERDAGRDERRPERDKRDRGDRDRDRDRDRRERDESPDARRHRRSTRSHRYETEDTDYSDREREHRRYREGSYTSKPPRPDDKSRRHDDRNRTRRYNTIERDGRRYDDERDGASRSGRREKYKYRDIDPTRKYGNLRMEREEEERRRGEAYSSPSRPGSREAAGEAEDPRRRERDRRHGRQDPYYDSFGGYTDAYALQRQQYQYYEHLRLTDPAAYLLVYKQLLAGRAPPVPPHYRAHLHKPHAIYPEGYGALGYDARPEERGSVHSGRSSANGLKGNDTYYGGYRHERDVASLRGEHSHTHSHSLRTDVSDRDLNTDASLNLHLEESTVRSERMTPFKFSTAHVKGSVSSRHIVVVRPSYPVDGLPATVHILSLTAALANDPTTAELANYPGPLVRGVTHKKSVIDYCAMRVRGAARTHTRDVIGYVLLWEFLALLLRQNGVVVGTDIAELLMKNKQEYEYKQSSNKSTHNDSRRGSSSVSGQEGDQQRWSPEQPSASVSDLTPQDESTSAMATTGAVTGASDRSPTDTLRELLTYGNRQEAIEYAMCNNLWGHALLLAAHGERRTRAAVASRFVSALPKDDPLHTLYALLQARAPPAAACVSDERWGDWRPHAAIMLSNSSAKPDQDKRTLIQLGDSLSSRGLIYSAQFCYLSAGAPLSRHPLSPHPPSAPPTSPPRLSLLLADARVTSLAQLATNQAIFATEVYEYALSLNQDYVIDDLQVYKFILACRLCDAGQYERALAYTEALARAVTRHPHAHSPAFVAQLADLAERLKYHEPALGDAEGEETLTEGSPDGSPRHQQWLHDVTNLAKHLTNEAASQQSTPQHQLHYPQQEQQQLQQQYSWGDQSQQPQQQQYPPPPQVPTYSAEEYSQFYQQPPPPPQESQQQEQQHQQEQQYPSYGSNAGQEEWQSEQPSQPSQPPPYGDEYWRPDNGYSYGETDNGLGDGDSTQEVRPAISMPAARPAQGSMYADPDGDNSHSQHADRDTPPKGEKSKEEGDKAQKGKSGWLGGILTKLSLRQPNQMILPDDKNPTIVWDPDKKRWRNLDADGEEDARAPPPPPKIQDLAPHAQIQNQPSMTAPPAPGAEAPPAAPVANIFKMQKGRHIKKSYVDVFNPSGAATRPLPPAAEVLGPAPPAAPAAPAANYFVPPALPTTQVQVAMPFTSSDAERSESRATTPSETGAYSHSQVGDDDTYTAPF